TVEACRGVDIAFVSAGADIARRFLPAIAANGTLCIDNSSAFRMEPDVPLVIPAVNPEALEGWPKPGIISVPNCTTITAMLAVAPLHRAAGCTSLVLSSYQAVSGAGHKAIAELLEQVEKLRGDEEALAHPDVPTLPSGAGTARPRTASPHRSMQPAAMSRSWAGSGRFRGATTRSSCSAARTTSVPAQPSTPSRSPSTCISRVAMMINCVFCSIAAEEAP